MVRFQNEQPTAIWFSQHSYGQAFEYLAVEKQGKRPVGYSAVGSHATYPTSGKHDHTVPGVSLPRAGILTDTTDQGTLWDPLLSAYFYSYDGNSKAFTAYDGSSPTNYLNFLGHWGDKKYPKSDKRQSDIFGISGTEKFVDG